MSLELTTASVLAVLVFGFAFGLGYHLAGWLVGKLAR